ncbi:hypothetical protein ACJJTC_000792 [Scirpophaga incertulas]
MAANKVLIFAGVTTIFQSIGQMIYCSLALAQYYCVVDFMRELPILVYLKIIYFHNPDMCGARVNIGSVIDSIADQAFVLLNKEPLTGFRTFIINCVNLSISGCWILASIILIMGGARNSDSKLVRWPWVLTTVAATGADLVATVIYANDSFYTRTLSDTMEFIGGVVSGIADTTLDTTWVAWVMVLLYSRFVVFFGINILLLLFVIVDCNSPIPINTSTQVEVPMTLDAYTSDKDSDILSIVSESRPLAKLPRPGLRRSFLRMKRFLFNRNLQRSPSNLESYKSTPECSPRVPHRNVDKKTVNFPENLLSLPQRLENLIAQQQRRLDEAVIDTAVRTSPPRASQSMPQLSSHQDAKGRRGTAAELQGQLPWAYIPASANRMRDQLPPDEDLPPVPLPDYSAIQPFRKASVHRAASSLSSLLYKREVLAKNREYNK